MKPLKAIAAFGLIISICLTYKAQAKTLTIGLDMSLSNPLVKDSAFADAAASYVAQDIKTMREGDVVRIVTFGARDHAANMQEINVTVPRNGASKVAKSASAYLTKTVKDSSNTQQSTNIVAWLELRDFACTDGDKIIVITDGIEASDVVSPQAFLDGKQSLPKPDEFAGFKGCEVVFYGLGVGWHLKEVKTLRSAWMEYFKAADAPFKAVIK